MTQYGGKNKLCPFADLMPEIGSKMSVLLNGPIYSTVREIL